MDPALYYKTFRPYIRFFEGVVYEGVDSSPMNFRGETGAQSSVIPTLVAFLKVPHRPSMLTDHLADMRRFMPPEHRALIEQVEALPDPRPGRQGPVQRCAGGAGLVPRDPPGVRQPLHRRPRARPPGTGGTPYLSGSAS